jgi:hypothetical protein
MSIVSLGWQWFQSKWTPNVNSRNHPAGKHPGAGHEFFTFKRIDCQSFPATIAKGPGQSGDRTQWLVNLTI